MRLRAQVGADGSADAGHQMTLSAGLLKNRPAARRVAITRQFAQPIGHDGFAVAIFLVAKQFRGAGLDVRRALAQEAAALLEVQRQFAELDLFLLDRGHQNVVERDALQQQIDDRRTDRGSQGAPAFDDPNGDFRFRELAKRVDGRHLDGGGLWPFQQR